jgi:hypothetical protein
MEPNDKKYIIIQILDGETGEICEVEISQEAIDAMDEAARKLKESFEEDLQYERDAWEYARDD